MRSTIKPQFLIGKHCTKHDVAVVGRTRIPNVKQLAIVHINYKKSFLNTVCLS